MDASWRIERISKRHGARFFACGDAALDAYLVPFARQDDESGLARTFVAVEPDNPARVVGYYSISAGAIDRPDLPAEATRRFPRFPAPAARLVRLAVDQAFQGQGVGEDLLIDALSRVLAAAEDVGIVAVVAHAKHEKARRFYARYGFETLPDRRFALWLPMAAIRTIAWIGAKGPEARRQSVDAGSTAPRSSGRRAPRGGH